MVKSKLEVFRHELEEKEFLFLAYHSTRFLFVSKRYSEAIKWISKQLRDSPKSKAYRLTYPYFCLILILSHYELGNVDVVETQIQSLKRFIKESGSPYQYFPLTFKSIKTLLETSFTRKNRKITDLFSELSVIEKSDFEATPFSFFNMAHWMESKTLGVDYAVFLEGLYSGPAISIANKINGGA